MNTSPNITDLPLEVLGLIFKELKSLREQLCLAQVHPHIEMAFCCHNSQRIKDLDTCELTVKECSVLLKICGSSVKHISGLNNFDDTMSKLVEQHCPNLQSIDLKVSTKNIGAINSLLINVKTLRSIFLYNDTIPEMELNLGTLRLLKFQPNLKKLHLMQFCGDELLEVRNLITLEELEIISSPDDNLNIYELCSRLKDLRTLSIQSKGFTASKEIEGVSCPALRSLNIYQSQDLFSDIFSLSPSTSNILKWILSHAETLEVLQFNLNFADCESDTAACQILASCKHLRYLYMPVEKAEADFAQNVIKNVSENGVTSKERPLKLNFYNQIIHDHIRKVMANTAAKQFISFKNYF